MIMADSNTHCDVNGLVKNMKDRIMVSAFLHVVTEMVKPNKAVSTISCIC